LFARKDGAQTTAMPHPEAESRIKAILGDKLGKVLIDSGIVSFTNKGVEYEGATYKDGSIVLNLDALNAGNFAGVFAHEGFHSTIRDLVGEQTYTQMMKRLDNMRALGNGSQWFKDAVAAVPADTKAENVTEEIAAYAVKGYVNGDKQPNIITRWVESLLSALRTAIIRRLPFGKLKSWAVNNLQPQDLANLAIAGLKAKAQGQLQAQGREAMAFSQDGRKGGSVETEFAETERAYGGREAYDRAASVGNTKLNYRQWVQVRTPRFKAWFGDWEKASLREFLNSAPLADLQTSEAPHKGYAALREWAVGIFKDYGFYANNPSLGKVLMDERSVRDSMSHGTINPFKAVAFKAVPDVIERGRIVSTERRGNTDSIYISAPVRINGVDDVVTVLVHRDATTNRMYLHSVTTKESLLNDRVSGADAEASERSGSSRKGGIYKILHDALNFNGDVSKVVDANGEPLVVYHGTTKAGFTKFETVRSSKVDGAYFFTSNLRMARSYSGVTDEVEFQEDEDGEMYSDQSRGIYSSYLKIDRPHEFYFDGANWDGTLKDPIYNLLDENGDIIDTVYTLEDAERQIEDGLASEYQEETNLWTTTDSEVRVAMRLGNDGAILRDVEDNGSEFDANESGDIYVVFDQGRVKSATGNRGTFDGSTPDIRYSRAQILGSVHPEIQRQVSLAFGNQKSTSWLTAVNTQYHKAAKWAADGKPLFKAVFDAGQQFVGDIARFGSMAQSAAPTLFHEWQSVGDVANAIRNTKSLGDITGKNRQADIDATAKALYEGTLHGGGNPMSGILWSDKQLRDRYSLTDNQIKLYREALDSVNVSMDELAKSIRRERTALREQ
ncbi:MAG: hypothetical protein JNK92_06025, partial [Dechloromonas sp.]|nr:hypothetical protein [Dechloromonas sp.]